MVSNRYNYALKNYGFSQGDIGKMMITFADTRSYLRAAIGYQDENLVNSCAENYEKKKESCQQYTKEVKIRFHLRMRRKFIIVSQKN